jgi:uncharacterized membrane protein YfcA
MGVPHDIIVLSGCIFAVALLYSSVGHGGASGYLAVMALWGLAPKDMRPTALLLNICVAAIAAVRFARAGCFSWRMFWPFAAASIPFAFLGGALSLPASIYRAVVGAVLLFAAFQLAWRKQTQDAVTAGIPIAPALACGSVIGLLSGLTGIGGGIFLGPLLVLMGWAGPRQQAGVVAPFVLVNSIAGIGGDLANVGFLPGAAGYLVPAGALGGIIGSSLGSRRLAGQTLRYLLAAVLVIASAKFVFA